MDEVAFDKGRLGARACIKILIGSEMISRNLPTKSFCFRLRWNCRFRCLNLATLTYQSSIVTIPRTFADTLCLEQVVQSLSRRSEVVFARDHFEAILIEIEIFQNVEFAPLRVYRKIIYLPGGLVFFKQVVQRNCFRLNSALRFFVSRCVCRWRRMDSMSTIRGIQFR